MAKDIVLIADDLTERTSKGRLRSRNLRDMAIVIAKKMKADVELLYVKNLSSGLFKKKQLDVLFETYETIESSIRAHFKKAKVNGKIILKSGNPVEEILTYTEMSDKTKILILGTQDKKGFEKILLGSVAEDVIRNSELPVLVLGPTAQEKKLQLDPEKEWNILLLTDLTESSEAAEKWTKDFCREHGAKVSLVHCLGDQIMKTRRTLYGSGYLPFDMDTIFRDMKTDAQRKLIRMSRSWKQQGIEADTVLFEKEQSIIKSLPALVKKNYDLVIMGTHGRNRIMTSFIGSTAREIILSSPLPVLVIRSDYE